LLEILYEDPSVESLNYCRSRLVTSSSELAMSGDRPIQFGNFIVTGEWWRKFPATRQVSRVVSQLPHRVLTLR
jgi:hypothetical protein